MVGGEKERKGGKRGETRRRDMGPGLEQNKFRHCPPADSDRERGSKRVDLMGRDRRSGNERLREP